MGQTVDRLDHYKVGGEVKVINPAHGVRCILVRWPMLEDEWCSPELLVPRETLAEGGAQ